MLANFDYYNRFEPSIISLCYPNNRFISVIDNVKNLRISSEFNAVSELSCDIYKIGLDGIKTSAYEKIAVKMQLFLEDVGYFIITDCNEIDDENGIYKSLSLLSCEHELTYKKINYFNGTYKLWDPNPDNPSLLGTIMNSLPRWTVKYVDKNVENLYRTFEEPDSTVYSFLMDDAEDAYECIFEFDIINREISVYDKNNFVNKTTILLSRNDVLNNIKVSTKSENVYTALSLYGEDDLSISSINPLGGATVYNFDYYKDWMSDRLIQLLEIWESKISSSENSLATYRTNLSIKQTELQSIQSEIDSCNEAIRLLNKQLSVSSLDKATINSINSQITTINIELARQQNLFNSKKSEIDTISDSMTAIYEDCSIQNNFTNDEICELDTYIFEASEINDNISLTDDMDYAEQETIITQLYQKAKHRILDISTPAEELTVDTNNFIFQKEFKAYTDQLKTGVLINIQNDDDTVVSYILLKMDIDYESKTLSMTFGNKFRTSNAQSLLSDWQSNVSKSSSTLTYERDKYGKAVNSGSLDKMNSFINSSLDLTLNQVKSADGQSVIIDDNGIHGKRVDTTTGEVSNEQIWWTNNNILFTEDNWQTIKEAIGKIVLPDGSIGYGINAEYLIGKLIIGSNIEIANENNTFRIDENGLYFESYEQAIDDANNKADLAVNLVQNVGLIVDLTQDVSIVSTDSEGNNADYSVTRTTVSASFQDVDVTPTSSISVTASDGITGVYDGTTYSYVITNMTTDNGTVTFSVNYVDLETSTNVTTTKKLSIVKNKAGESVIESSAIEPTDTSKIWIDTNENPPVIKIYDNTLETWEVVSDQSDIISQVNQIVDISITENTSNILNELQDKYYTKEESDNVLSNVTGTLSTLENSTTEGIANIQGNLEELAETVTNNYEELTKYMRVNDGVITLGQLGNQLTLEMENNMIAFKNGNTTVAYFTNNKLYVVNAEFEESLILGKTNKFGIIPRANGNLTIKKIS